MPSCGWSTQEKDSSLHRQGRWRCLCRRAITCRASCWLFRCADVLCTAAKCRAHWSALNEGLVQNHDRRTARRSWSLVAHRTQPGFCIITLEKNLFLCLASGALTPRLGALVSSALWVSKSVAVSIRRKFSPELYSCVGPQRWSSVRHQHDNSQSNNIRTTNTRNERPRK